jgi:hypothetical protein
MGHEVINPADMDRERGFRPESWTQDKLDAYDWSQLSGVLDHQQIVDEDLECLRGIDAIWMLNGWEKSKGANAEKAVAEWRQVQVFFDSESLYPVVESPVDPGTEIVRRLCELKDFAIANQRFGFAAWIRDLADRIKKELAAEKPNDHLADATAYASMMFAAKKMKPSVKGERRIVRAEALAAPYQGTGNCRCVIVPKGERRIVRAEALAAPCQGTGNCRCVIVPKGDDGRSGNKYHRRLIGLGGESVQTDVYRVLTAFGVTAPGLQHAIKKLLCAGLRDKGSTVQD